jgi:hypothetical protein
VALGSTSVTLGKPYEHQMNDAEKNLRDLLSRRFWREQQRARILEDLGIESLHPSKILDGGTPLDFWHDVVTKASIGLNLIPLVNAALKESPTDPLLLLAAKDVNLLSEKRGPEIPRPAQITASSLEALTQFRSTLLPIRFLRCGVERSKAVACIFRDDFAFGTGWLLPGNWLVTNNHVLPDASTADACKAYFSYEEDDHGKPVNAVPIGFDTVAGFHTSPASGGDDWTLVRLREDANTDFGFLNLAPTLPIPNDYVNIIQHPGGRRKEIALYHNTVTGSDQSRLHYLTDTEPGSSGSPVFNSNWEVVALHHASVQFFDFVTKRPFIANEGISSAVLSRELESLRII